MDFAEERNRIAGMLADAAVIKKNRDKKDVDIMVEEFKRKYRNVDPLEDIDPGELVASLCDPVLYPLDEERTGIPEFDLIMHVDIQGLLLSCALVARRRRNACALM